MPSSDPIDSSKQPDFIKVAILASIFLHLSFLTLVWGHSSTKSHLEVDPSFIVEILPPPPLPKIQNKAKERNQIVAAPRETTEVPAERKRVFESDQDSFTVKEQLRRGEEGKVIDSNQDKKEDSQPQKKQEAKLKSQEVSKPKQVDPKPREEAKTSAKLNTGPLKLKLDNSSIADITAADSEVKDKPSAEDKLQQDIQSSLAKNERSSVNVGRIGSRDYISDIPDGEVTLLNTKANKYAVFVRRVASQVFANLRGAGWQSLNASDIRSISRDGVYEAVLSAKGDLISVKLTSSSDSSKFDRVLGMAIQKGAKDPNPPAGAEAEDGKIRFIFQAKSWVQIQPNRRTGAPMERRWLVLGTGLE